MAADVVTYLMNPAEDVILFGAQLAEGMWVMPEFPPSRARTSTEDARLRGQRFRRVTRLRLIRSAHYAGGTGTEFIAEWVDGYQEVYRGTSENAWLVKKDSLPEVTR